ncbi:MAG: GNAT family N-acetyltransferase, partial [Bacteroidales bacterium]|nr:GNAT family N-acetyltransferase [Bacteroidales bacterium]
MKDTVARVDRKLLLKELTKERFLRETNYSSNHIYSFIAHEAPNLMKEVGRLREISFRDSGGGTGEDVDIDHYDISDHPYHQLIVWDPKEEEILGGYRYFVCNSLDNYSDEIDKHLATSHLFKFSDKFREKHMPYSIELGRSFVQPLYQSSRLARKGMYALDNLWDGLGALCLLYEHAKYFIGKVTMYTHYNRRGRDMILYFMSKHFPDPEKLCSPITPLVTLKDLEYIKPIFTGRNYD